MGDSRCAKARVAVIGAGEYGSLHMQVFKQLESDGKAELVCFAARSRETVIAQEKKVGIRGYTDVGEMLAAEKLDAVSIATPDSLHREIAVQCARARKHILVEKPMDTTVEGCLEMIAAARDAEVLLQVDFHKRYDPYLLQVKDLVSEGSLGDIQYGYAHMEERITMPMKSIRSWVHQTSPAWLLGVHLYDALRWILGSEVKRVYATAAKGLLSRHGIHALDSIQARLEFQNGASMAVDTSWILPEGFEAAVDQSLRIVGSLGVVEADLQDRGIRACTTAGMRTFNTDYLRLFKLRPGRTVRQGYGVDAIADFIENVNHILQGGRIDDLAGSDASGSSPMGRSLSSSSPSGGYPSGQDGLEATKIAAAVHRSIESGSVVEAG